MHELNPPEPYYLAAFLVGAYQKTLGDLHNLFGDTHVVHIRLQDDGGWWIEEIVKGDTANKVLEYMEYDTDELYPGIARDCERAIQEGRMSLSEAQAVKRFLREELNSTAMRISRSSSGNEIITIKSANLAFANNNPLA